MDQPALSAKKRIEKEVLEVIMDGLASGDIDNQKAQEIAKDALSTLKMLDEHEETIEKFYKNLAEKYAIFKILYTKVRAEIVKARELSAHRKALAAIDAGDVAGAHQITVRAISETSHETTNLN